MKIDQSSLYKVSVELKEAVKEFIRSQGSSKELWLLMEPYSEKDQEFLCSQFDRFYHQSGYEKSGIRVTDPVNGVIDCYRFGYKILPHDNPVFNNIRKLHLGEIKKIKVTKAALQIPKTSRVIDSFRTIFAKYIFNKPFKEVELYTRVVRLKYIINYLSENGITNVCINELDYLFDGLNQEQRNRILELFDSVYDVKGFKGIRYVNIGKSNYVAVDENLNIVPFKYNSLSIRRTVEILDVWKNLV